MELLTILYALLAAVTGVTGGDRTQMVQHAAVVASTAPCAQLSQRFAIVSPTVAQRPLVIASRRWSGDDHAIVALVMPYIAFTIAGFANRRE